MLVEGGLVQWYSKRRSSSALSTCESDSAMIEASTDSLLSDRVLNEIQMPCKNTVPMRSDNETAIGRAAGENVDASPMYRSNASCLLYVAHA